MHSSIASFKAAAKIDRDRADNNRNWDPTSKFARAGTVYQGALAAEAISDWALNRQHAYEEIDTRLTKGLVKTNDKITSVSDTVTAMRKEFKKDQTDVEEKVTALSRRESKYVTYQEMCRLMDRKIEPVTQRQDLAEKRQDLADKRQDLADKERAELWEVAKRLHGSVGAILEARALHQDHQPTPPPFTPIRPPPPPSTSIPPPLPAPNRTPTTSIPPPPFTLNQTRPPPSTSIRPPPSEPNRARPRAPVGLYQHHPLPGTYDLINEERLSSKRGFQDGAGWGRPDEADEEERSSKRSRYHLT